MSDKHLSPYLNEFEDIPGTLVFNTFRSRQGFNLNQFCMSLMKPENREKFKANEAEYLKPWKLTPAQTTAVLERDYLTMMKNGGNIYFLAKLFSTDGFPYLVAVATMTGMTQEEYSNMMLKGGRSIKGNRSKSNPSL
ncbi:MAG TPA: protocatechuate 4,5-dioxygenase subunit alpha [Steroidobacteraceae bacterium]|jgi:protocatechuate 4,5-dioxygenase alpha chain|nr:protocatechuate 4,5-dioxygenase subunit alpha [Steroidobacteraceae bacterium]